MVSTHSRPKAAAAKCSPNPIPLSLFQHTAARRRLPATTQECSCRAGFNTQPPEGGCWQFCPGPASGQGFNTQPPEGGCVWVQPFLFHILCFNTQPPEGGCPLRSKCDCASSCFNTQPPEGGCRRSAAPGLRWWPVSTHSRPKAAAAWRTPSNSNSRFQHTAARRRLQAAWSNCSAKAKFQHTAARRRLQVHKAIAYGLAGVSTHSRPKAAARFHSAIRRNRNCFNTQPPEGGCLRQDVAALRALLVSTHSRPKAAAAQRRSPHGVATFQHTAARRRLPCAQKGAKHEQHVSTHSRPKAAARLCSSQWSPSRVSTHSRPKAAASNSTHFAHRMTFQHTAARRRLRQRWGSAPPGMKFQHTAARRRLPATGVMAAHCLTFQHTAARRRLPVCPCLLSAKKRFQHTAARRRLPRETSGVVARQCFNTQPPEGGCLCLYPHQSVCRCFNTQPPEGGCLQRHRRDGRKHPVSTHSRPKAAAHLTHLRNRGEFVSTHSRPKAAARGRGAQLRSLTVSTHSRPKAAACQEPPLLPPAGSFNTQPPEGGCGGRGGGGGAHCYVSTHSRPKAAARAWLPFLRA